MVAQIRQIPVRRIAAVLIAAAILLPLLPLVVKRDYFERDHGIMISAAGKTWRQTTLDDALEQLGAREDLHHARISGYVRVQQEKGVYFVLEGLGKTRFFIDGRELQEMRRDPYGIQIDPTPKGFHHFELFCNPAGFSDAPLFMWTTDYVESQSIPAKNLYQWPVSTQQRRLELMFQWAGIVRRFNLVLALVILTALGIRWILRRAELLPRGDSQHRLSGLLLVLLAAIFFVRLSGIQYQLREGLHPDERMVENSVVQFRSGNLQPRQYFWSAGFEYLCAAGESIGSWVGDDELPSHLVARLFSACFSALSCWLLYSIARKFFDNSTAWWAAVFLGFTFMPIEIAHQGIVESTMVFFFLLAFRALIELDHEKRKTAFFVAGLAAGLAVSIKQTAGIIVLPAVLLFLATPGGSRVRALRKFLFWGIGALLGFLIVSPYILLDFRGYLAIQEWQLRSQQGIGVTKLFFVGEQQGIHRYSTIAEYLSDGMGYPILFFAVAGCLVIARKSKRGALLILPTTLCYFIISSLSATPPYHYALLLCPFVALLAAVALVSISAKLPLRSYVLPVIGIGLLVPSLLDDVHLLQTLQGVDTRHEAEIWCNRNLPPDSQVDYEVFGPRFLMPYWDTYKIPIFKRQAWNDFLARQRRKHYGFYVFDSITADVFDDSQDAFPLETEWFRLLKQNARVVRKFSGASWRIYNPEIIIFETISPSPPVPSRTDGQ